MAYRMLVDNPLVREVIASVKQMTSEKGEFSLVLLFSKNQRNMWTLVVSAPWLDGRLIDEIPYITSTLRKTMSESNVVKIERVATVRQSDPMVQELLSEDIALGTAYRVRSFELDAREITNAIAIVAKKPGSSPDLQQREVHSSPQPQ